MPSAKVVSQSAPLAAGRALLASAEAHAGVFKRDPRSNRGRQLVAECIDARGTRKAMRRRTSGLHAPRVVAQRDPLTAASKQPQSLRKRRFTHDTNDERQEPEKSSDDEKEGQLDQQQEPSDRELRGSRAEGLLSKGIHTRSRVVKCRIALHSSRYAEEQVTASAREGEAGSY